MSWTTATTPFGEDVAELRARARGPVLTPVDDGYEDEVAGFQTGVPARPGVVVGALDADDVAAAVRVAARHRVAVGVQATGHGRTVPPDGGVLVSTRRLDALTVDPVAATARVGAGVRTQALLDAAGAHGLTPVTGSSTDVGVVGYTLGGGYGLLSRAFGLAADHVRSVEVVTADGRVRTVGPDADPDLFWALRGARDDLGIVTAMELDLVPVARVTGGGLWFDVADAPAVLDAFTAVAADAPDELSISLGALALPDVPAVPEPLRGRHLLHVRFASIADSSIADPAVTDTAVARLRAAGTVLAGGVAEMPAAQSGSIVGDPTWAHAYEGTNVLVEGLDAGAVARVLDAAGPAAVLEFRPLGGAIARAPRRPSAIGFRGAGAIVRVVSTTDGATIDAVRARHARVLDALADRALGRAIGFVYGRRSAGEEERDVAEPDTRTALRRIRARYDPDGVFAGTSTAPGYRPTTDAQ